MIIIKEENKINLTIICEFLGRKQEAKIILKPKNVG